VARSKNQNFTVGEGKDYDGKRARTPEQMKALSKYSDRLRDYCHSGDPICAPESSPIDVKTHLNYFEKHNEEVLAWVVNKATGKSEKVSDDNTSTATASVAVKSAAGPTPTPSVIASSTNSATDSSEADASAQSKTGAASSMTAFSGSAMFVVLVAAALSITL
jgi:cobalamin biosynthesis Mg chelatase CobN